MKRFLLSPLFLTIAVLFFIIGTCFAEVDQVELPLSRWEEMQTDLGG
ncbi:MAG: hypothetical protein V1872_14400 [bacterium]